MKYDKDLIDKLVKLFKNFGIRHNHLVIFLLENNAIDKKFISKLKTSKLESDKEEHFKSIKEMKKHYDSLVDGNNELYELEYKLAFALQSENYEEACILRDSIKKIIRIKK